MLDWLRKLMAGDQHSAPPGATVERDAQGRVIRVEQSHSLWKEGAGANHPKLAPLDALDALAPRLRDASAWLTTQNILLAQTHGMGLEQDYMFDQDSGRLTLLFDGGAQLAFDAQIIGSFDPSDGSFMWGWANPSIQPRNCEDVARLKADGERLGLAALTTPIQIVTFDALLPLLALAAHDAGADGVYRCITNANTSVFLSIRTGGAEANGVTADPATIEAARDLVTSYDAEMLALDRDYQARRREDGILDAVIDRKMDVYRRYWSRDDDYHEPCSVGWPSGHDPAGQRLRFAIPHPDGGVLDITIGKTFGSAAYRVEPVGGELRITDNLIEWGEGLIWPDSAL